MRGGIHVAKVHVRRALVRLRWLVYTTAAARGAPCMRVATIRADHIIQQYVYQY